MGGISLRQNAWAVLVGGGGGLRHGLLLNHSFSRDYFLMLTKRVA
jgi:hypothetical protein